MGVDVGHRTGSAIRRAVATLVVASVMAFFSACTAAAPPQQTDNGAGYSQITALSITLQWRVLGTDLEVIVSAPTTGWVAVGFNPSSRMKDANIILAKVENGAPVARDDFGIALTQHASDESSGGVNDVTNLSGTESAGQTEMTYTIPLDSGDQYDRALVPGTSYKVLLSYSTSDSFEQKHTVRTSVTITL